MGRGQQYIERGAGTRDGGAVALAVQRLVVLVMAIMMVVMINIAGIRCSTDAPTRVSAVGHGRHTCHGRGRESRD